MITKYAFTTIAFTSVLGCFPGGVALDGETGDTGDTGDVSETGDGDGWWAEIRCIEAGPGQTPCLGRPMGADDAWAFVVADCELDVLIASAGAAVEVYEWSEESCQAGDAPSSFMPSYRCVWLPSVQRTTCYVGDGQWWTEAEPSCSGVMGTVTAWADDICGGEAGDIGMHPWSSVTCFNTPGGSCPAFDGNQANLVWPTCWVDAWPEAALPECMGETGDGDGDGDGDGESPCKMPLGPCPNGDCGTDGRRNIADLDCLDVGCLGLWSGTEAWSPALPVALLGDSPPIDPAIVWPCDADPDVDVCNDIDANGVVECYRIDGNFALPVWPACTVTDENMVDAGNGMCGIDWNP
jgi:hypothetical protein